MNQDARLVILTNGNFFSSIILAAFFEKFHRQIKGVVIVTGDYKGRTGLSSLFSLAKVTAWPYIFYKVITILAVQLASRFARRAIFSVDGLVDHYKIPVQHVNRINTSTALDWIAQLAPDLIVSVSCPQLIGKKVLSLARLGGINIHSSLLPGFAGLAPYFWVLSQGEKRTGITVHYMTLKFDQGNILAQSALQIEKNESAFHLFYRLAREGSVILIQAAEAALVNAVGTQQDMSGYSYYSNPTLKAYFSLKKKGHTLFRWTEVWKTIRQAVNESHELRLESR